MRAVLRPAAKTEAANIRVLLAATIATSVTQDEAVRAETIANVNNNVDFWLNNPDKCVHIVATVDGTIVGVILVKEFWNLCSLFVGAKHQGSGIGRALVKAAVGANDAHISRWRVLRSANGSTFDDMAPLHGGG